jgi:hypothetical protein
MSQAQEKKLQEQVAQLKEQLAKLNDLVGPDRVAGIIEQFVNELEEEVEQEP